MADLDRFVAAQANGVHDRALAELRAAAKRTHWMWFVFPQLAGLGRSETARIYAIVDIDEARAYLAHPLLGSRLREAVGAVLDWAGRVSPEAVMGGVDAVKLRSSLTLFEAAGGGAAFGQAIDDAFNGERDSETLRLLGLES